MSAPPLTHCPIHPEQELVYEPGSPDRPTLHGRVYCPPCQQRLFAALAALDGPPAH